MRFEELKSRFWKPDTHLEVLSPLTRPDVERAEAVLGVRLPAEYVDLLQIQNGGYVSHEFDAYPTAVPTSWADDHVWVRTLAGIGAREEWPSVTMSAQAREARLPQRVVPLSGDGHFWIALDYRDADVPSVAWLDTEVDQDETIAPDFRTFAEGLVSTEDFDDEDLPRLHVARGDSGSTYCGFPVDQGLVESVAEDALDAGGERLCPDCMRLRDEWAEAMRRRGGR